VIGWGGRGEGGGGVHVHVRVCVYGQGWTGVVIVGWVFRVHGADGREVCIFGSILASGYKL